MPFDGLVISNITHDLKEYLVGGRIEKVYQPGNLELLFHIHSNRKNFKLLISVESSSPRIHLINSNIDNPESPLSFCMLLRKHVQNGKILSIEQFGSERIIEILIESKSEMGFTVFKKIIIEIMGKHSNIIVIDPSTNRIIDSIKRIHEDINRYRQLLPGFQYIYPPSRSKKSFYEISEFEFSQLFESETTNDDVVNVHDYSSLLVEGIQGISPLVAKEICFGINDYKLLWKPFSNLINLMKAGNFKPVKYYSNTMELKDFYSFPLNELSSKFNEIISDDISEVCSEYYQRKDKSNFINSKIFEIEKLLLASKNKQSKKIIKLNQDIEKAENDINSKIYGELLMANLYRIKEGDEQVSVENYYNGETVLLPLDPKISPSKNAQIYFKKYTKSKKSKHEKLMQIKESESEIEYIDSILTHISNSINMSDIDEIKSELMETGYIKAPKVYTKSKKHKYDPIKYVSPSGFKVLVGKNNRENDYLTFKIASRNDIWLHTKDIPGSHVIIIAEGKEISDDTIEFAAKISAYYSKARLSGNVPVDYTVVKNVKKPTGAKPGMVIFVNNKTVNVNPSIPSDLSKNM